MSVASGKYDEVLGSILLEQKSIIGFLSSVFDFLARRTDFYYVPEGAYKNIGFPTGVAEELTIKVLRNCDPKRLRDGTVVASPISNLNDDIMCSTVAQEVEVVADGDEVEEYPAEITGEPRTSTNTEISHGEADPPSNPTPATETPAPPKAEMTKVSEPPQLPPMQRNSDAYNGAVRDNYSWAQTIVDLDVTVTLPPEVKSSKDLHINITSTELCVECARNKEAILRGTFSFKIKSQDTFWSLSEGRLLIHLEKQQERWWNALVTSETPIDLSKIDCSRPLDELPEEHVAKVRELQWNHERKLRGLPTSDKLRQLETLRRAWDADGSPLKGKPFDPSILEP